MRSTAPIRMSPAVRWRWVRERLLPLLVCAVVLGGVVVLWRAQATGGTAVGIAEGARSLVTSRQDGVLEEVLVQPYEYVEAGQRLGRFRPEDPRVDLDLVQMELQVALAGERPSLPEENALDYERARFELLQTQAELAMARVNLLRAENEERRNRPLRAERLVSEEVYDWSLQTRDLYAAEVLAKSNAVALMAARLEVLRSEADAARAPRDLVAPLSGMVAAVHRQSGEEIRGGELLFTVTSGVAERIVGYLRQPYPVQPRVGQRVRVATREQPRRTFWSEITQVGAQVEILTNSVAFLRVGMVVDSGLPFVVRLPAGSGIRPGELVDLAVDSRRVLIPPVAEVAEPAALRSSASSSETPEGGLVTYTGTCDASAGVALGADLLVVADDEDSLLRVYHRRWGGAALQVLNLNAFLRRGRGNQEADLEGSARAGDRIYWISSHGRNAEGKRQASRLRFFATRVGLADGQLVLQPEGQAYTHLLEDLVREPLLQEFDLERAATRAPKARGGLNIEGLCAGPDGALYIGFRNPVPEGRALLVPLLNPAELLEGRPARFGPPRRLDLGGLGIRSLEQVGERYLIVAGLWDAGGESRLYRWDGGETPPQEVPAPSLRGLNPEAITAFERDGVPWLQVLSDDGARIVDGVEAKRLTDPTRKTFRGVSIPLPVEWGTEPAPRTPETGGELAAGSRSALAVRGTTDGEGEAP